MLKQAKRSHLPRVGRQRSLPLLLRKAKHLRHQPRATRKVSDPKLLLREKLQSNQRNIHHPLRNQRLFTIKTGFQTCPEAIIPIVKAKVHQISLRIRLIMIPNLTNKTKKLHHPWFRERSTNLIILTL